MTAIIFDFAAIRWHKDGAQPGTLAELIAEERRAWDA
jgi:hypothetical protein